jgi:cyclic pyranopterin phosphate synthase
MSPFTHIDAQGQVRMVDVTEKAATVRSAVARGQIRMAAATLDRILNRAVPKGNVLETARIAGVLAAKRTGGLIPMCHPLNLTHVRIDFSPDTDAGAIGIEAEARLIGPTGVEMEALTAVSIAALTIYDMCKAHDREMVITDIHLAEKSGGKSGHYVRRQSPRR